MKNQVFLILSLVLIFAAFSFVFFRPPSTAVLAAKEQTQEKIEINFFYSENCLHCAAEQKLLDEIEEKYPEVKINRYDAAKPENQELLIELCKKCDAEKYIGLVPLTFVGEDFFLGFDSPAGIGKQIEDSIQRQIKQIEKPETSNQGKIHLPIVGEIDTSKHSLPVLAVLLGTLDGFNLCSLGALVLILGLVLALRSRRKILIFGGIFILTTAVVYASLIILWYKVFYVFASYLKTMEVLIGFLAMGGGVYFLRQFIKFKKQGPTCKPEAGGGIATKFSPKIQDSFRKPGNILAIAGIILLFAAIVAIVEFPCSAVVPVVFAGILAKSQLPTFLYLFYIALFVLFYMLDEILVFLIAVFKMTVWLASPKFVTWATLIEGIILFLLGFYYLIGF